MDDKLNRHAGRQRSDQGDTEGLMPKLMAARDRYAKGAARRRRSCFATEAGYDAFWLARFLKAPGIECLVVDAASMQVNRRARRAKTDRIDVGMLLRALIAWGQGDRHVWSVVRVPSVDEEDLRRSHREPSRLVREQTAHINWIKGPLFAQGIRGINIKSHIKP
jgi:transposase